MPRRRLVVLLPLLAVFLLVAAGLARYLAAPGIEREEVVALVEAQARGDAAAMERRLADGCERPCAELARRLRRPGAPKVLSYRSRTAYTLSTSEGRGRVAWATVDPPSDAVVQCVTVRKRWSWTAGARVTLRALSAPIAPDGGC